jgi:hypothetical protein
MTYFTVLVVTGFLALALELAVGVIAWCWAEDEWIYGNGRNSSSLRPSGGRSVSGDDLADGDVIDWTRLDAMIGPWRGRP